MAINTRVVRSKLTVPLQKREHCAENLTLSESDLELSELNDPEHKAENEDEEMPLKRRNVAIGRVCLCCL